MNFYSPRRSDRAEQLKQQIRRERLFFLVVIAVLLIWLMAERMSNRFWAIQVDGKTVVWARCRTDANAICDQVKRAAVGDAPIAAAHFCEQVDLKAGRFTGTELLPVPKAAEVLAQAVSVVVDGWVIRVDGEAVVGLPTKEKAEETLKATLDQFRPRSGTPEGEPHFEQKVTVEKGRISSEAFYDSAFKARDALLGKEDRTRQYLVRKGDTLASIARDHKITTALLLKLNPDVAPSGALSVGQRLFVRKPQPPVTVVAKAVEIEHAKPGEAGVTGELPLKRVLVTYKNGEVVSRETIE